MTITNNASVTASSSIMNAPCSTASSLEEELASIVRVRNRLAATVTPSAVSSDDIESKSALRFHLICTALLPKLIRRLDRNTEQLLLVHSHHQNHDSNEHSLRLQIQGHIMGTLSHALERIRLLPREDKQSSSSGVLGWAVPIVTALSDLQSTVSQTMALALLEEGIRRLERGLEVLDTDTTWRGLPIIVASLIRYVDRLQNALFRMTADCKTEKLLWQRASWLLLDCLSMAVPGGIKTHCQKQPETLSSMVVDAATSNGSALMDLILDLMLYWPPRPRWGQQQPDNSTGLSPEGWNRLGKKKKETGDWEEACLRQLKYSVLYCAIWPYRNGLFQSIMPKNENELDDRALLLAVLSASPQSAHGRLAISFLNLHDGNNRIRHGEDIWHYNFSTTPYCSLGLACSLVILILGDDVATPILERHSSQEYLWSSVIGVRSGLAAFSRSPLPVAQAGRAIQFIQTHFRPENISTGAPGIRLFVDLVAGVVDDPSQYGSYWRIQLLHSLHAHVQKRKNQDLTTTTTSSKEEDEWTNYFCKLSLEAAKSVLSAVPRAIFEISATDRNSEANDNLPLGVPEPFGRRRDLNRLLKDHREGQKKRRLQANEAILARRAAYCLIRDLSDNLHDFEVVKFEFSVILFQCSAFEGDKLHPILTEVLDLLLARYKERLVGRRVDPNETLENEIAPLLPALLCAASADSCFSREAAARWCGDLVVYFDPAAAHHICLYLVDDPDFAVSSTATRGLEAAEKVETVARKDLVSIAWLNGMNDDQHEIDSDIADRVRHVTDASGLSSEEALLALHYFQYREIDAVAQLSRDFDSTIERIGMKHRVCKRLNTLEDDNVELVTCGICYDHVPGSKCFSLPCSHMFCLECWSSYVVTAGHESKLFLLQCPHHECDERMSRGDIQLVSELARVWDHDVRANFIEHEVLYQHCPGPDCDVIARLSALSNPSLTCIECGTNFCFGCGGSPHAPAACEDFVAWGRIFGSSRFWVKKNSKPCPCCKVPIEKNQGCNHVHCTQCRTDFCWLCLSLLHSHLEAHTCNRFDPASTAENDEEKLSLFFTDRFEAHEEAEKFEKRRVEAYEENPYLLAEKYWYAEDGELEALVNAVVTLVAARSFLKNSYIKAWANRNETNSLFAHRQATVELLTERLSRMTTSSLDDLHRREGDFGVRNFFRVMGFYSSSVLKYMERMRQS